MLKNLGRGGSLKDILIEILFWKHRDLLVLDLCGSHAENELLGHQISSFNFFIPFCQVDISFISFVFIQPFICLVFELLMVEYGSVGIQY